MGKAKAEIRALREALEKTPGGAKIVDRLRMQPESPADAAFREEMGAEIRAKTAEIRALRRALKDMPGGEALVDRIADGIVDGEGDSEGDLDGARDGDFDCDDDGDTRSKGTAACDVAAPPRVNGWGGIGGIW